jgi:hypothetical protein
MTASRTHTQIELPIVHRIITNGLKAGYAVSVFDGEEWALKRSTKRRDIYAALASTDSDQIRFCNASDGRLIGTILFIWGNGQDVVSDYTDKPEIEALVGPIGDGN